MATTDRTGFLERLGVGGPDPRALAEAQRSQAFSGLGASARSLGRQAAPLVGAAAAGVGGLVSGDNGGRSFGGFRNNLNQGAQVTRDTELAQAAGISLEQLRNRREIRNHVKGLDIKDDGSFDSRLKLASSIAEKAQELGATDVLGPALEELDQIKKQREEFGKLEAEKKSAEGKAQTDNLVDAFHDERGSLTGAPGIKDGVPGLWVSDKEGGTEFVPWGDELTRVDPARSAAKGFNEPLDVRIRRFVSKPARDAIRDLATNNDKAIRKFDRVMSTLTDLTEEGGAGAAIARSGDVVAFTDNLVRNIKGVFQAFAPSGKEGARQTRLRKTWLDKAADPNDPIWDAIDIPESARRTSVAAQQHRANLMELAYMAASLAEPSGRGLSDSDIKNATLRLGGSSSNPQVMMRRFAEMMGDAANELDFRLSTIHGSMKDAEGSIIPDEEIDRVLIGRGGGILRDRKRKVFDKHNFTIGEDGRAVFEKPIDDDVQPGEGIVPPLDQAATEDMSDEELLDAFLGEEGS